MDNPRFEITKLIPTNYDGIWVAEFVLKNFDTIGERGVAQEATYLVRFAFDDANSAQQLLATAYEKARETALASMNTLSNNSIADLRAESKNRLAAQDSF